MSIESNLETFDSTGSGLLLSAGLGAHKGSYGQAIHWNHRPGHSLWLLLFHQYSLRMSPQFKLVSFTVFWLTHETSIVWQWRPW